MLNQQQDSSTNYRVEGNSNSKCADIRYSSQDTLITSTNQLPLPLATQTSILLANGVDSYINYNNLQPRYQESSTNSHTANDTTAILQQTSTEDIVTYNVGGAQTIHSILPAHVESGPFAGNNCDGGSKDERENGSTPLQISRISTKKAKRFTVNNLLELSQNDTSRHHQQFVNKMQIPPYCPSHDAKMSLNLKDHQQQQQHEVPPAISTASSNQLVSFNTLTNGKLCK